MSYLCKECCTNKHELDIEVELEVQKRLFDSSRKQLDKDLIRNEVKKDMAEEKLRREIVEDCDVDVFLIEEEKDKKRFPTSQEEYELYLKNLYKVVGGITNKSIESGFGHDERLFIP